MNSPEKPITQIPTDELHSYEFWQKLLDAYQSSVELLGEDHRINLVIARAIADLMIEYSGYTMDERVLSLIKLKGPMRFSQIRAQVTCPMCGHAAMHSLRNTVRSLMDSGACYLDGSLALRLSDTPSESDERHT